MVGLSPIVEMWVAWNWLMFWQISFVVLVLWLIEIGFQSSSARLRYWLWTLVLIRMVLPPHVSAPTSFVWWLGNTELAPLVAFGNSTLNNQSGIPNPNSSIISEAPVNASSTATFAYSTIEILFFVWLGVIITRFVFLALASFRVRHWVNTAQPITEPRFLELLEKAKQQVGVTRNVELRDSQSCVTPLVTGLWSPKILIPSRTLASYEPREMESVVLHELIHLRRGDTWIRCAQAILSILYFFHPAVWLANYFLHRSREDACDEATVQAMQGRRKPYAAAIIKAASMVGYQPPHLSIGMLQNTNAVTRRVRRVLDPDLPVHDGRSWLRFALITTLALVLLPSGLPSESAASTKQLVTTTPVPEREPPPPRPPIEVPALKPAELPPPPSEQQAALRALESTDFIVRREAYAQLRAFGSRESLDALEQAYLKREGVEQQAAKDALDAVWRRIRQNPVNVESSVRSPRVLEPKPEEYP